VFEDSHATTRTDSPKRCIGLLDEAGAERAAGRMKEIGSHKPAKNRDDPGAARSKLKRIRKTNHIYRVSAGIGAIVQ
jgi:hypothetical protein